MPEKEGGTATIFIKNEFGSIDNVMVRDNLLYGNPSYTIYVEETSAKPSQITNVTLQDNYVEKGLYGYYNIVGNTPVLSGNVTWQEGSIQPRIRIAPLTTFRMQLMMLQYRVSDTGHH